MWPQMNTDRTKTRIRKFLPICVYLCSSVAQSQGAGQQPAEVSTRDVPVSFKASTNLVMAKQIRDELTVVVGVFDHNGVYVASIQKVADLRLRDETLERWLQQGISVRSSFDVKPGTYLLRLVVRDARGQLMGAQNGVVEIQ